jgi:hypothetical protein
MKTKHLSFPVIAVAALAFVSAAPAYAATDNNAPSKTPAASTVKKETSAASTAKKDAPVASDVKKDTPAEPAAQKEAPTDIKETPAAQPVAETTSTPTPPPAAAPAAKESSSILGGVKSFFGFGKKEVPSEAPSEARAGRGSRPEMGMKGPSPERPVMGARPLRPESGPRPAAGPRPDMPTIGEELSAMEKEVNPKDLDAAKKVAKLFDMKDRVRGALGMSGRMMAPMIERENPGQMDKIQKSMNDALNKMADEYEDDAIKNKAIYLAKTFNADELEQLQKFYESSVGKKMMKEGDQVARGDSEFSHRLGMLQGQKVREAMIKEMKKNDLKIPKNYE